MKSHDFAKYLLTQKDSEIVFDNSDGEYDPFAPSFTHTFADGCVKFVCFKECGELDVSVSNFLPKLYSIRVYDNDSGGLFQSWDFSDYLEYCDTVSHVLASDAIAPMKGCTLQSVAVFSGGFELVIWEKRYE